MDREKGARVNDSRVIVAGALLGALAGIGASYLFFTDRGRHLRDRFEPTVDDLRREFTRFQKTVEKLGAMANDGMRVVQEFNNARSRTSYSDSGTSH